VSRGVLCEFIAAEKTTYGVRRLCRVVRISPASFYAWAARAGGPTAAELEDAYAIEAARTAWAQHRQVYGARRLTAEIRDRGHAWNRKQVARLMRLGAIEGMHRRKRGKYGRRTVSAATAPDLVERNFTASAPDRLWVADISYLRTWEGFVYLAVVVDAFSRKVVGWAMADHLRTELALDAVGMAITARRPAAGTVHHTDRGTQYTSYEFGKALRASDLLASMGRVGSAFDNAMAESVFATLKSELIYRRAWPTRHELEMEVFSYLEGFYNTRRRHSRLGNLSPTDYETMHLTQNEVSA
jgi:transposase InsO family protein